MNDSKPSYTDEFEQSHAEENTDNALPISYYIALAKVYLRELLIFSWLILMGAVALGYFLYSRKAKEPTSYTATISFMLSEDGNFNQGMIGSLFGTVFNNSEAATLSLSKLDELIFTRSIIQQVLFAKSTMKTPFTDDLPKEDFIINHYIDLFGFRQSWIDKEVTSLIDFRFKHDSFPIFTRDENSILLSTYSQLVQGHLSKYSTPGGIMTVNCTSINEAFSYEFLVQLFDIFNAYYTDKATEKQQKILEAATKRVVKLKAQMEAAEQAYIEYRNKNNATSRGQHHVMIQEQYLTRELQVEMEAYFAAVKAREVAEAALAQSMPLIQVVDAPIYPLYKNKPQPFIHFIIGFMVGFILLSAAVIGRKLLKDYLKKSETINVVQPTN